MATKTFPKQHQERQPGIEKEMNPRPKSSMKGYKGSGKLKDKVAIVTGGDSGIGKAASIAFAKEGAHVVIVYLDEHEDAKETKSLIEKEGRTCFTFSGDIGQESFCKKIVDDVVKQFGKIDILVNNAAEQHVQESIEDITEEQLVKTFRTNIFAQFFMVKAALKHMSKGSTIINTTSVTAYKGMEVLLDYSATKGAIEAFTYSLSQSLVKKGIRVNAVAPGPIWTPLIPASFGEDEVSEFGTSAAMGRAGQPDELAPCYVFLASTDSSYMTGQVLHPNGGSIVHG